jgi:hypothetical protein
MTKSSTTRNLRKLGYMEEIILNALRTSNPDEQIRVQPYSREGVSGYAVEVTRLIFGEEYSYNGWISMQALKLEPWPIDQRHMIDRAFEATLRDIIREKGN